MKPICYENTSTDLPGWIDTVHHEQKYGYAYETGSHFVHLYGKEPYYIISVGLTVTEGKAGSLEDWVKRRFGASNIEQMDLEVGHTVESIWRPSLYFWEDTASALKVDPHEQVSQESALRILMQQLDDLLLYIEPSVNGLECYSHKTRELLILSSTEVENQWRSILQRAQCLPLNGSVYTTNDYARLIGKVFLEEFSISLRNAPIFQKVKPFDGWDTSQPTQSLPWYAAYNETKHDRYGHFDSARLKHVLAAVAANVVLYSVRFNPLTLVNGSNAFSALVNQMFQIVMESSNRKSFYIPLVDTGKIMRQDCIVFDCYRDKLNRPWKIESLRL
jgi:hypothetical protein